MYAFLLLLSLISTAAGLFAIGFGLAPYELSLGNALIVAGAVAIIGGMILFGLAAAVRQLRRIADAVGPRPLSARRPAGAETAEAASSRQTVAPRVPHPQRLPAEPRGAEARAGAAPAAEAPEGTVADHPRPTTGGAARDGGEPLMVDEHEAVPLAPSRGSAAAPGRGAPPRAEPAGEPKPTPADIMARLSNLATPPRSAPPRTVPSVERPAPEQRGRENPNMFDTVWPAEGRAGRQSQPEAIARAPRAEVRPEPRVDSRPEPRLDVKPEKREPRIEPAMPRERGEPPVGAAPRERIEPTVAPPPELRPIAILKSGVIDGMAYTLYTDGSIEAELPHGTMRFGSIDELRAHLEKAERQD